MHVYEEVEEKDERLNLLLKGLLKKLLRYRGDEDVATRAGSDPETAGKSL